MSYSKLFCVHVQRYAFRRANRHLFSVCQPRVCPWKNERRQGCGWLDTTPRQDVCFHHMTAGSADRAWLRLSVVRRVEVAVGPTSPAPLLGHAFQSTPAQTRMHGGSPHVKPVSSRAQVTCSSPVSVRVPQCLPANLLRPCLLQPSPPNTRTATDISIHTPPLE